MHTNALDRDKWIQGGDPVQVVYVVTHDDGGAVRVLEVFNDEEHARRSCAQRELVADPEEGHCYYTRAHVLDPLPLPQRASAFQVAVTKDGRVVNVCKYDDPGQSFHKIHISPPMLNLFTTQAVLEMNVPADTEEQAAAWATRCLKAVLELDLWPTEFDDKNPVDCDIVSDDELWLEVHLNQLRSCLGDLS